MKVTIKKLKALKAGNKLEQCVKKWIIDKAVDYDNDIEGLLNDLMQHGCASGMVSELIYYANTTKFYQRCQGEINSILYEMLDSTGCTSAIELFGDKWEKEDPFCRGELNQNLMAWFGFEETARKIADELGLEV